MTPSLRRRVLAIGIDAAEPTLLRARLEGGELPALRRLRDEGTWSRVTSPAAIGSAAVWPTFATGADPSAHGSYGVWPWRPETMSVDRARPAALTPFWGDLARRGMTVGVLDVPFAPLVGLSTGFEISEWGAHDAPVGRMEVGPAQAGATIGRIGGHPFAAWHPDATGPDDHVALARLSAACLDGVKLRGRLAAALLEETRPDLAIVVFPELHTAAHHLWHTIEPGHPFYADARFSRARPVAPSLLEILREIDRQIARLVEVVGSGASVFVFGLHGMQPTRGVPDLLDPVLRATGFARAPAWREQTWPERARAAFAAAKRRAPSRLKAVYYRGLSREVTHRLAKTTMLPVHDWRHTRAFSLPSDQYGWIRVSLVGREARGIVPRAQYDDTCRQLDAMLRGLTTEDGRTVVRDVIHTAREYGGQPPSELPDLIAHWEDAAFDDPVRLRRPALAARPFGLKFTGQHALDGFCVTNARAGGSDVIQARDLYRRFTAALADA